MITIQPYSPSLIASWDRVLDQSINGTFMHSRDYIDYHGDKFDDASLLIYRDDKPVGLFPAHKIVDEIHSHQGLTYGGFILYQDLSMTGIIAVIKEVMRHYLEKGMKTLIIKDVPSFYGSSSLEWMPYCMFLLGADNFRTELSFAIPLPISPRMYTKGRKWRVNKAKRADLTISETQNFQPFWEEVLVPNLWERHRVKPVHTLEEIKFLAENNKPFIRQFEVLDGGKIVAGATIYETKTAVHSQYLSSNSRGRKLSALDLLIDYLVRERFPHKAFFNFGIVNESQGRTINKGLMDWKESFGAKPYVHQFYKVETARFRVLEEALR